MSFSTIYDIVTQNDALSEAAISEEAAKRKTNSRLKILLGEDFDNNPATTSTKISNLKSFLEAYSDNVNFGVQLFGEDFKPASSAVKLELSQKIYQSFINSNEHFKYFPQNSTEVSLEFQRYKQFYIICLYQAQVIDGVVGNVDNIESRAYKMAVLLPTIKSLDALVLSTSSLNLRNPIADLFDKEIPLCANYEDFGYNLDGWKSLILAKAKGADIYETINLLKIAREIQGQIMTGEPFPENFQQLQEISLRVQFSRYVENPSLAKVLSKYKLFTPAKTDNSNKVFETALKLYENGTIRNAAEARASNNMPDVFIDVGEIDKKYEGKYWIKLPKGDYRGLILGDTAVICCQSLTKDIPQELIYDGMSKDNSCFYVMIEAKNKESLVKNSAEINWDNFEENYKIIAESYAYRGKAGSIILDSIETAEQARSLPFVLIMQKFGEGLVNSAEIKKIIVGGGGTGKIHNFLPQFCKNEKSNECPVAGTFAYDSTSKGQYDVCNVDFYRKNLANSGELKNLSHEKIYAITSDEAIKCYDGGIFTLENLAKEDVEKIKKLTIFFSKGDNLQGAQELCKRKLNVLALDDHNKLHELASEDAISCYNAGYVNPSELAKLDRNAMPFVTSHRARECYKLSYCSFADLSQVENRKVRHLTSEIAQKFFDFKDLKEVGEDVLGLINSPMTGEYFEKNPHQERNKELASALLKASYKEMYKIFKEKDFSILSAPKSSVDVVSVEAANLGNYALSKE